LFRLTFFFAKKKKGYKKEVGERAARPLSIRLCTFCVDELIKIETQVCLILTQTLELSKISCYFYKFIPKYVLPSNIPLAVRRISLFQNITVRKHNITCRRQISLRISFRGNTLNSRLPFRSGYRTGLIKYTIHTEDDTICHS